MKNTKRVKCIVMSLLLIISIIVPSVKAEAKDYTGEFYVDGTIYEGTPLSEIEIKGTIYDDNGRIISTAPNWSVTESSQKFTYVTAGTYSEWWHLKSYEYGEERHFGGIIKFEVIPVPDLVVTETKPIQYPYGTQLSDIKPNCTFTTVARKVMEGTITWDSTETPNYGTSTYGYTFTPSDSRYNSVSGTSTVVIKKKRSTKKIKVKYKTTKKSIIITPIKGCEYSIGGKTWQDSNVFTKLKRGEKYKFYVRYKETDTTYAGGRYKKYIRTKR